MDPTMTEPTQRSIAALETHVGYMREAIEKMEKQLGALATRKDLQELKDEVDKITPWVSTLETLVKVSRWLAAIAAGLGAVWSATSFWKH